LLDDSYWRTIDVNATGGVVCSYKLLNENKKVDYNTFEVQISNLNNAQIGLYYSKSTRNEGEDSKVVDLKLFT